MSDKDGKEAIHRKLALTRRLAAGPLDPVTIGRLKEHAADLERRLAEIEAGDTDAPPELPTKPPGA